jgi:hypothetical protein
MKSHSTINKHLYDYLRGEMAGEDRHTLETHLATCKECSADLDSIRKATELLNANLQRPSEHRSELYWQRFAEKVERRIELDSQDSAAPSIIRQFLDALVLHRKPFGIGFASALTLIMIAFGIWSVWMKNPLSQQSAVEQSAQQSTTHETATVQKAALESQAQDYLEQSKILLIGLVNTDTKSLRASGPLLQREQEISRMLVSKSGDLTSKLNDPSQRRLRELISDLQLILVQIANLGTQHDVPGVEIIKGGIEHNDILFKINLEEIHRTSKSTAKNGKTVKRST